MVAEAKESYIADEWHDYTIDPKADRLANKGTNLKGSEHSLDAFGKGYEKPKASDTIPVKKEEVPQTVNSKPLNYIETASISSGSDNKNIQETLNQISSHQAATNVDYLAKSNPVTRAPINAPSTTPDYIPSSSKFQQNPAASKPAVQNNQYQPPIQHPYQPPTTVQQSHQPLASVQSAPTKDFANSYQNAQSLTYQPPPPATMANPMYNPL